MRDVAGNRRGLSAGTAVLASLLLVAAALIALTAAPQTGSARATGDVDVFSSGKNSELIKTLPIKKKRRDGKRVVMTIPGSQFGTLAEGSALMASAEVEVTTCLKANSNHSQARDRCTGRPYGYDPHVVARLVLGSSGATGGVPISRKLKLTCNQSLPARNHHCVLALPWQEFAVPASLPCSPDCHLNLVMSSWHRNAKRRHKLVIGADSHGPIVQGKGRINLVRFEEGPADLGAPLETTTPVTKRLPVARDGGDDVHKLVYSLHIPDARQGEKLMVDSRVVTKLNRVPYNVALQNRIGAALSPDDLAGERVSEGNGVNCTKKGSAHSNPCKRDKFGIFTVKRSGDLYIQVTESAEAKATTQRWRRSDRVGIGRGYLRVWRFPR